MSEIIKIDFSALSLVANKLLDKISSAVGWVVNHDTPKRIATRTYIEEIEKLDIAPLHKAALISRSKQDIKEYSNQLAIVSGSISFLSEKGDPVNMNDDWISQFFDKARLVSDKEFQLIWSRLLAEECNDPGSVPKSLLFILEKMNRQDAECFTKICQSTILFQNEPFLLVQSFNSNDCDIQFVDALQLEALGLVKIESYGFAISDKNEKKVQKISYFDYNYVFPSDVKKLNVGELLFTNDGRALYKAISVEKREGFWDDIVIPWCRKQIEDTK